MDFLEFSDITAEIMGAMAPGKLKLTDQQIIFKNIKTGKLDQFPGSDIEVVNWQRLSGAWGIRIFLNNGTLHRFGGFKEPDQEKISKFFSQSYGKDMLEKELSLKGWNWGTAKFHSGILSFDVGNITDFEIPLNSVSQCTTGKNEVTMEFHQNDDAPVGLMELRFHIPSSELAGDKDPVEAFQEQVMSKASVITATGDAIAIFREVQCLTPRGRYDIRVYPTFLHLHGKTFDFKITVTSVLRLFLLPHKDGRQMFFVISMDPPIKQGMTRYHFLITLFNQDEETDLDLPFADDELHSKFAGRMPKEINGPTYEVLSKVMKALVNRKITVPGGFKGHSGTPGISCSYKAAAGYLYPLERGFIYIHKPPLHIRFEELVCVHFARSGGSTRSFDFEMETRSGIVHTFSSIEKEEYTKLFDYTTQHKLRVKNTGKMDGGRGYTDDFKSSGDENESDPYLARVKAEARERSSGDEEESSEDEDFNPGEEGSDVAEEYDSDAPSTDSESGKSEGEGGSGSERRKKHKEKRPKKAKTVSEKPRKPRRKKKIRDENKPKRPQSAYFIWLNESRSEIKEKYPGISIIELSKKAGEMWKNVKDRSEWDEKAAEAKKVYEVAMKEYKASGGGQSVADDSDDNSKKKPRKKTATPTKTLSPSKAGSGGNFKSKEYISEDSDSSSAEDEKPLKKPSEKRAAAKSSPTKSEKSDQSEEEVLSSPASNEASGAGSDSD